MAEYEGIIKDLQQGKYSPVYFLQGEEAFFIDNIIEQIEGNALDDSQKSFNQYVLYGKETDLSVIISTARKFPMMGERQVVIVKEAQELKSWKSDDAMLVLEKYLENPSPSTILAFAHKYRTLDQRKKISKVIANNSVFLTSKSIRDYELLGWIQGYARARQVEITQRGVHLLAENIGNNLQRLSNEINKLLINRKDGQPIDEHAIQKYVGISKDFNNFELQTAVATKNFAKALKIAKYFAANPGNHPIILTIATLFSFHSKMLLLNQSGETNPQNLAKILGVNPYFVKEYLGAAQFYTKMKVLTNIQHIHEFDLRSKGIGSSNKESDGELLKEMIYKLMH